ncbi:SDR family NAD(P)-dependent oxidoreductase [Legionella oakridgensis]|nr:SDR family NAD(P)-dependent oxidoreductase [Legionella oakridgensis]ETO92572.1 dehydrogenase with different specificities [Legionella oakridgensis RV-2-2007]
MYPETVSMYADYRPANKLKNKVVLITGGDSGIGRVVAYHCIAEGAKVALVYLNETSDAEQTLQEIKKMHGEVIAIQEDLSQKGSCKKAVVIPASFSAEEVASFGSQSPMNKPAQPADIAPCYVFQRFYDRTNFASKRWRIFLLIRDFLWTNKSRHY